MLKLESLGMRLCRSVGLERLAWSLRRLYCPVSPQALVLEVGSGGNPYARANVLLDAYEVTRERHWAPLVTDRPTVLGFVETLPFRDKVFDFVIASHVLEHSTDPARFLSELQRVAKAGYIETPDAFMERINPYQDHRLEVTVRDGRLMIYKKSAWRADPGLVELYEYRAKPWVTQELIPRHPFDFHVRYYWENTIDYSLENPTENAGWTPPEVNSGQSVPSFRSKLRHSVQGVLRSIVSQQKRNQGIDLITLLRCPSCGCEALSKKAEAVICVGCGCEYPIRHGIPIMTPDDSGDLVKR